MARALARALLGAALLAARCATACTTFAVTPGATSDGRVLAAHSNDWGSSPSPGTLALVAAADHAPGTNRSVSGGAIPQVAHTHKYFTEGYGVMNEHQLGVAESTCAAKPWPGAPANAGVLSIVDLSRLALERATAARAGVALMGALAEEYGYDDAAESLLVVDPFEVWIFHVLRGPDAVGAVWAAQRVPDGGVAAVANAFTLRALDFDDAENVLASPNVRDAARAAGWWDGEQPFDFTKAFAAGVGPQYASGRRAWRIYSLLAPANPPLPSEYGDYVNDAPYPPFVVAAAGAPPLNVTRADAFAVMRDFYAGTPYALDGGMAGGYAGTPERWAGGDANASGGWERAISLYRSQVVVVLEARSALPDGVGGVAHFTPNAAHGGTFVPLAVGMTALPACVASATSWAGVERWSLAWATRFAFQLLQLRFDAMYAAFAAARADFEAASAAVLADLERSYVPGDAAPLDEQLGARAAAAVDWMWAQSDALVVAFANNANLGYPSWWLESPDVGYVDGPTPSPRRGQAGLWFSQ